MAWCQTGNKPLSEPMLGYFTNAYMCQLHCIHHRTYIRVNIHKRHPISHPHKWVMGVSIVWIMEKIHHVVMAPHCKIPWNKNLSNMDESVMQFHTILHFPPHIPLICAIYQCNINLCQQKTVKWIVLTHMKKIKSQMEYECFEKGHNNHV